MVVRTGRRSIFRDKDPSLRVVGILTSEGYSAFEDARFRLSKLALRKVDDVSDADVIEFLARGEPATGKYIRELEREDE